MHITSSTLKQGLSCSSKPALQVDPSLVLSRAVLEIELPTGSTGTKLFKCRITLYAVIMCVQTLYMNTCLPKYIVDVSLAHVQKTVPTEPSPELGKPL